MNKLSKLFGSIHYSVANYLVGNEKISGQPILLSGNGRSGTSWIGETIGRAPGTLYYREPCHPRPHGLPPALSEAVWCRYLRPGDRDAFFESALGAAFRGHFWQGSGHPFIAYRTRLGGRPRVVVKEVASFLSLEWVATLWNPAVLIILRHPGAYAASVRNLDQDAAEVARFRLLRDDPNLRRDHLEPLLPHLETVREPLEAAVASWAIRTSVVLAARRRHPEWRVVHYEDVACDPLPAFQGLYHQLSLEWTDGVEDWLRGKIGADNGGTYSTARRSETRIDAWRSQLSAQEALRIRRVLEPFDLPDEAGADNWPR